MTHTNKYQVVREDNGPRNPHTGVVKTGFASRHAAHKWIDDQNTRLRHNAGSSTSWHPYRVEVME